MLILFVICFLRSLYSSDATTVVVASEVVCLAQSNVSSLNKHELYAVDVCSLCGSIV